jgi:CDP-4-dehydro-6-deoxyglucose reductase/ferredoxin-NAD(P)+ reductase (naphthalene dioxygenase ferredoxin-specific)
MSFKISIRGRAEPVVAEIGETILAAATRAGVPYPYGCRSGNCGACKSQLYAGDVELSPYSEYALSKAERAQDLILACRAVPWSDCEVAWLEPDEVAVHPLRKLDCEVVGAEFATHDIRVVRLRVDAGGPFEFTAGQFAAVTFPGQPARDYSMASRADQEFLEFHIRLVPGGAVTAYVTERLHIGDRVRVEGPHGTSYYRSGFRGPILALAGGSGVAPIKSIVETALRAGARQPIRLYFGARAERDLYLEAHFRALAEQHSNLTFVPVLSEPDAATTRRTGFLSDAIAHDFTDLDGYKAYLAGPPPMIDSCVAVLKRLGLARQHFHADAFYTEAEKAELEKQ